MWATIWLWLLVFKEIPAYRIDHWDCSSPKYLHKYSARKACVPEEAPEVAKHKVISLLAHDPIDSATGLKCAVLESTFNFVCGVWGHLKVATVPIIQKPKLVTPSMCETYQDERVYVDPETGQSHPIELDRVNYFALNTRGQLTPSTADVSCTGEDYHSNGVLHKNNLQVKYLQVILETEKFKIKGDMVETESSHLTLPCRASSEKCTTSTGTYLWSMPKQTCNFKVIQTLLMDEIQTTHLLSDSLQILINRTGPISTNCDTQIYGTNLEDVYVAESHVDLPPIKAFTVDISANLLAKLSYFVYQTQKKLTRTNQDNNRQLCELTNGKSSTMTHLHGNFYSFRRGDIIYKVECEPKTSELAELDHCVQDIPIIGGNYVDPVSRVTTNHSSKTPCSMFSNIIETKNGIWVAINPQISVVKKPDHQSLLSSGITTIQDPHLQGLYTATELQAWHNMISFPKYQKALLTTFSVGNCVNEERCTENNPKEDLPVFSLENLKTKISVLNPLDQLKKMIIEHAAYLSFAVLVICAAKFIITLSVCMMTLYSAGPAALCAMLARLCCGPTRHYRKVLHATRVKNRTQFQLEELQAE